MKIFRYTLAFLLALALLVSSFGCGYAPVKSSEEELATVLRLDGTYDVPYELYRFYFLSELALSEQDPSKLSGEEKEALFAELHQKTLEEIADVYAVLKLCEAHGIDVESKEFDEYVEDNITYAVEGSGEYVGYGDHETYLAEIKKAYMNDSVFRFLLRYRRAEEKLGALLRDTGVLKSDRETVLSYMNSDDCVRVSWIYIPYTVLPGYTSNVLELMEAEAKAATDEEFLAMTHRVIPDAYTDDELDIGFYIGKHQLDPYYDALTETAFSLAPGETSGWIDSGDGRYLVRRLPKDARYLAEESNLADFTEYYLLESFYGMLAEEAERLASTVSLTDAFGGLTFDTVKMPE